MSRTAIAAALLCAMLAACRAEPASNASLPATARTAPSGMDLVQLTITGAARSHVFTVEMARTPAQQERGLMYRRALGPGEGMLFPFDPPRPASFWMRNTLIPLDMIFIRPDGTIARIAANTVPMSQEQVAVNDPVTAVLEIRGGRAAELGITTADRVAWAD